MNDKYSHIIKWFKDNVPNAESELDFDNAFKLITAVILSAQCTDKRVNMVTPTLFERFGTPQKMATASFEDIYEIIKSISYPNNKTKHLIGMAKMLVKDFDSRVPDNTEDLQKLPGVGRKTANVVASIIYERPVIAVDTHVFRVSRRTGLSSGKNVTEVEKDLTLNIPEKLRPAAHHWLILHGRYICTARKPRCNECGISGYCNYYLSVKSET